MNPVYEELLKSKMSDESYAKLTALENEKLFNFIGEYVELCEPDTVYMCNDSDEDAELMRQKSLDRGEEIKLAKNGQTMHYDGYGDQARDKGNTKFMVSPETMKEMGGLNTIDFDEGLVEIKGIAKGIMKGNEAIVKLFCEGPAKSPFTVACAQITDSYYVSHSEDMLYRRGYEHFMTMEDKGDFFRFCHSAGELDERGCSVNLQDRRIYQDLENMTVYSMNAQYAGNAVGLKKHSMRLAIKKSDKEGWLCEHMFIMGCQNREVNRTTYFCGAYPSACGKTATAMIPGETIVGDDIAYFKNIDGEFRAVNVERGIFGIIRDVNAKDDPVIYETLTAEKEVIFSNVLTGPDNEPYWSGMDVDIPKEGTNHSGHGWTEGKIDANGKAIDPSHANSRYTIRMEYLDNLDPAWDDRAGVLVGGVIYGGRDSDTSVPVEQSHNWADGIILKACTLESETTAAILGQEGVRVPQPMANLDFISYSLGRYIKNNLEFTDGLKEVPLVFGFNYFLRTEDGEFCTDRLAKKVWLHWAEKRVHGEVEVQETPTGLIPYYEDIAKLFKELLDVDYSEEEFNYQFSFRCDAWLAKIDRAIEFFASKGAELPAAVTDRWAEIKGVIEDAKAKYGNVIAPGTYGK